MSRVSKRAVSLAGGVVAGAGLLLLAGAFVGASPALADNPNSPHVATEGTTAANATTCAGCHRAHSAKSSDGFLLTQTDETTLCFSCHGTSGTGASTDVQDGVAYAVSGTPTTRNVPAAKTGALRGGGFNTAYINSAAAERTLFTATGDVDRTGNHIPADMNLGANTTTTSNHTMATSSTLWGSGAISAAANGGKAAVYLKCTSCHNPHGNGNYRILKEIPQTYNSTLTTATNALATTGTAMTATGRNVTITAASGAVGTAGQSPAAGSVILTFTVDSVATPVQLNAGEMISVSGTTGFNFDRASINSVANVGGNGTGNLIAASFTVEGTWATPAISSVPTAWIGTATVTPLFPDVSNGTYTYTTSDYWNADDANTPQGKWWTYSSSRGLSENTSQFSVVSNISAWCSTCHTRYNANSARSTNSGDDVYKFRHTSNSSKLNSPNCIQCHVAHGSNAVMSGNSMVKTPTDSAGNALDAAQPLTDSKLLRADGRGICELCHNE